MGALTIIRKVDSQVNVYLTLRVDAWVLNFRVFKIERMSVGNMKWPGEILTCRCPYGRCIPILCYRYLFACIGTYKGVWCMNIMFCVCVCVWCCVFVVIAHLCLCMPTAHWHHIKSNLSTIWTSVNWTHTTIIYFVQNIAPDSGYRLNAIQRAGKNSIQVWGILKGVMVGRY